MDLSKNLKNVVKYMGEVPSSLLLLLTLLASVTFPPNQAQLVELFVLIYSLVFEAGYIIDYLEDTSYAK